MSFLRQCVLHSQRVQRCLYQQSSELCHQLYGAQSFHSSAAVMAAYAKKSKKKYAVKKKEMNKKSLKMQREVIVIHPKMTVQELADAARKDVDDIYECFLHLKRNTNHLDSPNKVIDDIKVMQETLDKCGYRWKLEVPAAKVHVNKEVLPRPPPDPGCLVKRPPVVAIMGHIDHGKTTLLDRLRKSSLVKQEFGGITQHIGAFSVKLENGDLITFLDTPGHAAFHKMRSRGAKLTDIVILVVAADDGAMTQTAESIRFAEKAGASLIVAINKIDRPEADIAGTRRSLLQYGLVSEEEGGDVQMVPISALHDTNLSDLKEAVITLSEVLEVRGDPTGSVEGTVIESRLHPNKGKLCSLIVQRGTLKKGAFLVADCVYGKVRAMYDDHGNTVHTAGPGTAVEILGWRELPSAGDFIQEIKSEKSAQEVVQYRQQLQMQKKALSDQREYESSMSQHWQNYQQFRQKNSSRRITFTKSTREKEAIVRNNGKSLGVVIKGDVDGSVEAILDVLSTYQSDQCSLDVLSFGIGSVTEEDVKLAADFSGVVFAFNTPVPEPIKVSADKLNVPIASHNVIYKLVDDLRERLQEQLPSVIEEEVIGDVDGSVEAILDVLSTYQSDQCSLDVLSFGIGSVTEEDVKLAADFSGVVFAFNTPVPEPIKVSADKLNVPIASHNVIYKLVDDLRERLQEQLPSVIEEEVIGEANVLELFMITNGRQKIPVAGCRCVGGSLSKKERFKLVRDNEVLFDGELTSMRQQKNEVQNVRKEMECGLQFSDPSVIPKSGDQVLCYQEKEVGQTLEWDMEF